MKMLRSFCTAFSLYSTIPMPQVPWEKESMAHALCFFPLVGAVIGGLQMLWLSAAGSFPITPLLYSVIAALLSLLVSGGIHLDGFMDTVDALSAHVSTERRLEILKDPHTGAFGVAGCMCVILLHTALWYQVYHTPQLLPAAALGYTISRTLNALSIATFPCARTSGLVYTFSSAASKKAVIATCLLYLLAELGLLFYLCGAVAIPIMGGILLYFYCHRDFCIRNFGGNTGDLAGFLSLNCETICLFFAAVGGILS